MEGYTVTEYKSVGADFGAEERQLILLGTPENKAQIIADGQELTADSLFYSEEKGKVWSTGSEAIFQPQDGDPVNSRIIVFDLREGRGTALGATTRYSGQGEWIVHGDLTSVSDTASWGTHLSFTSCELEVPHYHFASNNVKIVRGNLLVARPVKLYFADVPVAWLPFMVQNMEQGRSSGILTPTFSVNDIVRTSQSYSRRISNLGFYWAGTDYYDATVFMDWWSGEHVALTGSARFNWAKQFLTGGMSYRRILAGVRSSGEGLQRKYAVADERADQPPVSGQLRLLLVHGSRNLLRSQGGGPIHRLGGWAEPPIRLREPHSEREPKAVSDG